MRRRRLPFLGLILILILATLPAFLGSFHTFLFTQVLIFAMFAIAYNLMFGYGGLPSLGHAAFFGGGAYGMGIGLIHLKMPFWLAFAAAPALGALGASLFGLLTLRARGIYFLVLTLLAAQALWGLAFKMVKYTGGDQGLAGFGRPSVFGWSLWSNDAFFYFTLAIFALSLVAMRLVVESPFGHALVGMRESESRLLALGYPVSILRLIVFAISGFFSGLAGALLAVSNTLVDPSLLYWLQGANVMLMAIVGGTNTFLGPFFGATILVIFQQIISSYTDRWTMVLGAIYVAVILFAPHGLTGLAAAGWHRLRSPAVSGEEKTPPRSGPASWAVLTRLWGNRVPSKARGKGTK